LGIGLTQVHDHQAIDDLRKLVVEVNADQLPTNLCVLLDQDRDAFAIDFDIRRVQRDRGARLLALVFGSDEGTPQLKNGIR
jgi:hypothetical protein